MKLAFIGGGVMGEAIIRGLLQREVLPPQDIVVSDVLKDRLSYLKDKYRVRVTSSNKEAIKGGEIAVLAIKPQTLSEVALDLKGSFAPAQTLLSIVAGATIATLVAGFKHPAVVRVMPNTPAQIGEGISVWTATPEVSAAAQEASRSILSALGEEIYVPEEKFLDMATALSASGPAYVFLIIEALTDSGVHMGFSRDVAQRLVIRTLTGSANLVERTGKHPAELKNMVTSPGGTTAEGLLALESGGLRATLIRAVLAAYEKAKLLGGGKDR